MTKVLLFCSVNIVLEYIKYQWNAKGRHGTHSPFVYDFVDKVINVPLPEKFLLERKRLIQVLKNDYERIEINDFGAGSKKMNQIRKVKDIFKNSSSRGKFGSLLYRLSNYYKAQHILEFGTSLGFGTIHLASGNFTNTVYSIEACPNTIRKATENIAAFDIKNVQLINSDFRTFIAEKHSTIYDIIFIDGHHDGEALKEYVNALQANSHDETIFVLDDIRWSESMLKAWNELVTDQRFHLSLDLFRMGILMKRKHQNKEHFVLRY